jgi:hypothetical protein
MRTCGCTLPLTNPKACQNCGNADISEINSIKISELELEEDRKVLEKYNKLFREWEEASRKSVYVNSRIYTGTRVIV